MRLGRLFESRRRALAARDHLSHFVEVTGADLTLVLGGRVALGLRREFCLLQLGIGRHATVAITASQFEHAVIYDPVKNEEFTASRGDGAHLNGRRIRVSNRTKLAEAVLSTGIPPGAVDTHLDAYMASLKDFTGQCRGIRRMGSAALDLAYVAAGRVDGFWELSLSPWDICAGTLLVREAGGFVGDWRGGDNFFKTGNIVASNPKTFRAMVQGLRPHLTPAII